MDAAGVLSCLMNDGTNGRSCKMGKVVFDISMSLDGFIAGLHDGPDNPMGDHGVEALHQWIWGDRTDGVPGDGAKGSNREVLAELKNTTGAIVVGRRTYDIVDGWGGTHPFGAIPAFVVTKAAPEHVPQGGTKFTFVTDGIESAVKQARAAAGDRNVYVVGGANIAQQCLKAGLLDEMRIHIAPLLLGEGIRLFDHLGAESIQLERTGLVDAPGVTHLTFRFVQ
jgi:dihydrofolate reductase